MTKAIKKDAVKAVGISGDERPVSRELVEPEIIAAYGQILPGAPERILRMTEQRMRHRHWIEKAETVGKHLRPVLGILFATAITLLCLAAGIVSVLSGHAIAATVFSA